MPKGGGGGGGVKKQKKKIFIVPVTLILNIHTSIIMSLHVSVK